MLFEKDASGLTKKAYTRALGFPGGIGGLISMKRFEMEDEILEEKISYYHYDALGSVRGLSNEQGKLNAEFDYDAFGNGKNNKPWNTYRFSSKEFEDHAGLYYFGARYYDPEVGRWLTPDPLGFIDGPNRYLYVANNPLNFIDPYGEFAFLALLPIAYAAFEIGLSALDVYSTASTLFDSSASGKEKALSAGLFIAGVLTPGGGYSTAGNLTVGVGKKITQQMNKRGWSESAINATIKNPAYTKKSINKITGNKATAYFGKDGSYVVQDDVTGNIIQISNKNDPNWIPDRNIK